MPIEIGLKEMFAVFAQKKKCEEIEQDDKILLIIRANHMKIRLGNRVNEKKNAFLGKILRRKFMGVFYRFEITTTINMQEKIIIVTIPATNEIHTKFVEGLEVTVYFPKELGIIFKHPDDEVIKEVIKLQ